MKDCPRETEDLPLGVCLAQTSCPPPSLHQQADTWGGQDEPERGTRGFTHLPHP